MTVTVLNALIRPLIEQRLPDWVEPLYFSSTDELRALAPRAEIGWFDLYNKLHMSEAVESATKLKWLNSIYAGVESLPLDLLAKRGVTVTNGAGINAITIAEYVVMAMLTIAKGYREVVRAADRQDWIFDAPGKVELNGTTAMIIGYGAIGALIHKYLVPFGVACSVVRRNPGGGVVGPDDWRPSLPHMDWVILTVPATPETDGMIGAEELAAMKSTATLINVSRGSIIDQDALVTALTEKRIGAAFLDVTTPEPLPADHPLWQLDNAHISMHLSGKSQSKMFTRGADRFLENLDRYRKGEPLSPQVNLSLGY
jgi:phosphoglycerate dehydrogenase-like enzyme